jgi:hypothetical protein
MQSHGAATQATQLLTHLCTLDFGIAENQIKFSAPAV